MKTQRRREGMGCCDGEGEVGGVGYMWNLRMPVFSMRWRRRAVIHFDVLYMGAFVFGKVRERMSMFHFHIR